MAKNPKPKAQKKPAQNNIQRRIINMFAEYEPPAYVGMRQLEALKARITELEEELAHVEPTQAQGSPSPKAAPSPSDPDQPSKYSRWMSLSWKILAPTLLIFSLVFVGFFLYTYLTATADAKANEAKDSRQAEEFFLAKIQNIATFATGLSIQTATNPEVQAAFAARDRDALYDITIDTYRALEKQYQIRQFQFHLVPATSFLRLHSPTKFGDDLSTFRFTVLKVNATGQPISGLEVGRGGAGIRGVEPVFYKGRQIGSVEFGLNFDEALVASLKTEYGNDWRIMLTRDSMSLATLEDLSLLQDGPTPDLLILASTIEGTYPEPSIYAKVLNGERFISPVVNNGRSYSVTSLPLRDYSGDIIGVVDIMIDRTAIVQAQNSRIFFIALGVLLALVSGAYSLTVTTNRSLKPLAILTRAAEAIEKGDLNQNVQVTSKDEVGQLAQAFNAMVIQLRDLFITMEQRIADRTHDLGTASEVGRAITEKVANRYEMMAEAVEIIRSRFNLYYTQIYLVDPSGRNLVLSAGTGQVGAQLMRKYHHLPIGLGSINGRAVSEKQAVIIEDTEKSSNFLPNPLLPLTRSEMSVPLMVGDTVVGVLDMQSDQPGALNETTLPAFTALAGQLAIAIQNAFLFAQTEQARAEIEEQSRRLTAEGWQEFLDGIERSERIGFAYAQDEVIPLVEVETASPDVGNVLAIPFHVTGTKVGEIRVEDDPDHVWTETEKEIIQATATQVAQHIENLRLLAKAEKYRDEAEQAVRRLTREGWEEYLRQNQEVGVGFLYDGEKVSPVARPEDLEAKLSCDIKVGGEPIGQLSIARADDAMPLSDEEWQLIVSVTERLSAHIENLRLSTQTEQALAASQRLAQREQTLRQITAAVHSSTNPETILRMAVRELGSAMGRRAIISMAMPDQSDDDDQVLNKNGPSENADGGMSL
ncbi:MAG: cache domain-containing protein [Chloroflexota bacterium]